MSYQISQKFDSSKVFLIDVSKLEGRLDPLFYGSNFTRFMKHPKSVPLKNVCVDFSSGFSAGKEDQAIVDDAYIQIRPTNIDNDGFLKYDKNVYVPIQKGISFVEKRTVLFNNTNSQEWVGKTAILLDDIKVYTSNHITSIVVDETVLDAEYLWIVLNVYQRNKFFYSICTNWNNQSGIGIDLLKSIRIPLHSLSTQQKIINHYNYSFKKKQEKEQQAESLLQSIDDYLLNALGIHQSEANDNNATLYFIVNKNSLEGRLDPIFYDADIKRYTQCTYSDRLSNLALSFVPGFAVGRQDQVEQDKGILQLRPTNIDNNGRLKFDKNVYVPEVANMPFVESGAVLFNNTNSQEWVGKTTYFANEENKKVYTSNHITAITVDRTKILPEYLCAILNMYQRHKVFYSICTNWNNQSGVGLDLLKSIQIPLFTDDRKESLRKQQEIVDHITAVYQQAKALQEEGKAILEHAKKEVEQMILGN